MRLEPISQNVRYFRKLRGMTQVELAKAAGTTQYTVSEIELAHREPHPATLRKLAAALGVRVADFYGEAEVPKVPAPPSQRSLFNGGEEERRSLTVADYNAAETFADVCNRLERSLAIAEREPVGGGRGKVGAHYLIRVAAGLSLPLMEKEAFLELVLPTAARFIELARRFEELRESEAVPEEEVAQSRELVHELTQRISKAA
jgi:transcriptional regulator with XRE-family HTH domain